jgi:hypothetical protein
MVRYSFIFINWYDKEKKTMNIMDTNTSELYAEHKAATLTRIPNKNEVGIKSELNGN